MIRLSFAGSTGWSGSTYSSRLPLPLVSRMNAVQHCDFCSSPGLVEHLGVEPPENAAARAAAAQPQCIVGILSENQMVRAEAGVDERKLFGLRLVNSEMAPGSFHREQFRRWMVGTFLAEGQISRWTNSGGEPDPLLFVEHGVVNGGLAVPNAFRSPERRRRIHYPAPGRNKHGVWGVRIAHGHFHFRRPMAHRIENRHEIRAVLGRTID